MKEQNDQQQGLQLELPQDVAQGEYANFAIITHSSSDFIIDFARVLPGVAKAQVKSRSSLLLSTLNVFLVLFKRISCAMKMHLVPSAFLNNNPKASRLSNSLKVKHRKGRFCVAGNEIFCYF